jgi:thioredoxin
MIRNLILIFMVALTFSATAQTATGSNVKKINSAEFKKLVSDYEGGYKNWKFIGKRPVIIDFYADWCGPCKKLAPIVDELSKEYKGKIDFYKIDIDANPDIAKAYSISSIPMLLLVPATGSPQVVTGLYPKEELVKAINYVIFPKK